MLLCKTIPVDAQAESNVLEDMYMPNTYVVDCRLGGPKFTL